MASVLEKVGDDARAAALAKWMAVFAVAPGASQIGLQLNEISDEADADTRAHGVLEDVFARKATSTMNIRASAMLMYVAWVRKEAPEIDPVPISESTMYRYLTHLKETKAPATRANSFMQA
eukprot:gb/GFBE01054301.1/.p1 GENE.gb/GFBE01054301.1/~~gb/GFBE01054301.1/.p1  ORF type:complete len:121 (+),score=33.10 gb/GFBE01054301.1/:1-363(+)